MGALRALGDDGHGGQRVEDPTPDAAQPATTTERVSAPGQSATERFSKRPLTETAAVLQILKEAPAPVQRAVLDCQMDRYLPEVLFEFALQKGVYSDIGRNIARFLYNEGSKVLAELVA